MHVSPRERLSRQSVTIVDVARAAGVSVSTVSRVARNHPDVNSETRGSVLEVIRSLGYRPSPIARALVAGHSQTIALLVGDIANPFYPQLAKGIEREAREGGYALVICNTDDREQETERYVQRLVDEGVGGVIHASVGPDEERTLEQLRDVAKVVFTNRRPRSAETNYVVADSYAGAVDVTQHLVQLGHRRIGFVKGPQFATNADERLQGFLHAVNAAGVEPVLADGDFAPESGTRAVARWLEEGICPTAVIGVDDVVALGAYDALLEAGLRIPEDVAVAGFDNIQLAGSRLIGLTTVAQHIDRLAVRAVRMLLGLISGQSVDGAPLHEVIRPELLVRRSTIGSDHAALANVFAPSRFNHGSNR